MADHSSGRSSIRNSRRKRSARTALAAFAAGTLALALASESFAQGRGFGGFGMGGRGFGGNAMHPHMGTRFPGGDGPRSPGGMIPRRPGGGGVLVVPSGGPYGPYGPGRTVVEIDDDPVPRRVAKKKAHKQKQQVQQLAPRGGFNVPPAV